MASVPSWQRRASVRPGGGVRWGEWLLHRRCSLWCCPCADRWGQLCCRLPGTLASFRHGSCRAGQVGRRMRTSTPAIPVLSLPLNHPASSGEVGSCWHAFTLARQNRDGALSVSSATTPLPPPPRAGTGGETANHDGRLPEVPENGPGTLHGAEK